MKKVKFLTGVKYVLAIFSALLLMILFNACSEGLSESGNVSPCLSESIDQNLQLVEAKELPVVRSLRVNAEVTPNPDRVLSYVSLVSGIISRVYFSLGDYIDQGSVLADLRSPELSALYAERRIIQSQKTVANRNLATKEQLHADGISSQRELMEARSQVQALEAELARIESYLSFYTEGPQKGIYQIRAAASGYVVEKNINPGSQVSAEGDVLFTISDLSTVWVQASVYPGDVSFVAPGMKAEIQSPAYPDVIFTGSIDALSHVFDLNERVLKARIVMPNTGNKLKPGLLVTVDLKKPLGTIAVGIPASAIIFSGDKHYALVYEDACNIRIAEVNINLSNNGMAFLSSGINPGEQIITRNHLLVYEQLRSQF